MKIRFRTLAERHLYTLDIWSGKVHPPRGTKLIVKAAKPRRIRTKQPPMIVKPVKVAKKPAVAIAHSVGAAVPTIGDDPPDDPEPPPKRKTAPRGTGRDSKSFSKVSDSGRYTKQASKNQDRIALHDGRQCLGFIAIPHAFDEHGRKLPGNFISLGDATNAILAIGRRGA